MPILSPPEFYPSWPKYGKRLSFQWGESRKNADTLKILSRSLDYDENIAKYLDSAVAGYEYGEDGFHNRFRTFYDKDTNNWLVQFNSATEAAPVWVNYLTINSIGTVTFAGSFYTATLDVRAGGNSGPVPPTVTNVRHLIFHAADFYITQNSLSQPIVNLKSSTGTGDITNAVNLAAEGVFASKSGANLQFKGLVAGPNITLTPAANTITIESTVTGGGGGFYGIGVVQSDNKQGYSGINTLSFEAANFYIKRNSTDPDKVQINLRPSSGGAGTITGGTALGGTEPVFAGTVAPNLTFKGLTAGTGISLSSDANEITITNTGSTGGGGGFYGITVGQSDNINIFKNINVVKFNTDSFYVQRSIGANTDEAIVSLRKTGINTGAAQDFGALSEWEFTHNLNSPNVVWGVYENNGQAFIPQRVDISNNNIAYFYMSPAMAGKAVVLALGASAVGAGTITGGTSLGGTEPVYGTTTAPTINFKGLTAGTGISLASDANAITVTNTGPTLSQIGPGFYGITVIQSNGLRGYTGLNVLSFEAANFYLTRNTTDPDKVQINLRPTAAGGSGTITGGASLGGSEPIFASNAAPTINFKGITAGTGISLSSDANAVTVTNTGPTLAQIGPGFYGITVGQSNNLPSYKNINTIKFLSSDFYVNQNATNPDEVIVNLRPIAPIVTDSISFEIEAPYIKNYFLDSGAFQSYTLNTIRILTEEGAVGVGFYIRYPARNGGQTNPGIGVTGLNFPLVNNSRQEVTATGANFVFENAELIMSIFYIHSGPKSLRGTFKVTY